jgi:predicted transglutaminase-like cysteine proteinase
LFLHHAARRLPGRHALAGALLLVAGALPAPAWDAGQMRAAAQRIGAGAVAAVPALQALLAADVPAGDEAWLASVNGFFNRRIAFRDDARVWGVQDHWASPLEALDKGAGDCEDYAIGKFFTLLAAGMPAERLRLVYVRARVRVADGSVQAQAHMVLAYYPRPGADPLILDNLHPDIVPAARRGDLTPVFSFNHEGLWHGTGAASAGDPAARLSRWREVLAKARAEGFL